MTANLIIWKIIQGIDFELDTLKTNDYMVKKEFSNLITNFNCKPLNDCYVEYSINSNAPFEFIELLKTNDLKKRDEIWQTIQNKVEPSQIANPFYVGFGNPNSEILIIGKELGFDNLNKTQLFNESIQNIFHWELYLKNGQLSIQHFNNCEMPYFCDLPNKEGHTWRKYDKLLKKILKKETNEQFKFLEHCFLTEYNYLPSPTSNGKSILTRERKALLEHDFFKTFKIIINNARAYDEGYMDKMFNVKWIKTDCLDNSKRKYLLYINEMDNRKLIMIDQLSGAWADDDLSQIANLLTG